jgi:putative endopeptidase
VLDDGAKNAVKAILETGSKSEKAVKLYDMCMDTATVNSLGAAPLLPLLRSLRTSLESASSPVESSVALLHKRGISSFFNVYVDADPVQPTLYSLTMEQGGLTLTTKDYYVRAKYDSVRKGFQALVEKVFTAMSRDKNTDLTAELDRLGINSASAAQVAADVFDVEMQIANASNFMDELRNSEANYNPTTLSAMTNVGFSFVEWSQLITSAPVLTNVITTTRTYFPAISSIISRLKAPSQYVKFKRYMAWRAVLPTLPALSKTYVDLDFAFFGQTISGKIDPPQRSTFCVSTVNSLLGFEVGRIYVEKFFSPQQRAAVEDLAARIENVFGAGLPKWLTAAGRAAALGKLAMVKSKIGYPGAGEWKNYSAYVVEPSQLAQTLINMAAAEEASSFAKVYSAVNKKEWFMTPQTVNAYYNPSSNDINFPAAILQPPFFSDSYPAEMNYGALGMVVGHELTHGFDDDGRRFDGDGKLDPAFWPAADVQSFDSKARCVADQYSGFTMKFADGSTEQVNGNLTLGENLADLGGIELAFRALQQHFADRGASPRLVPELSSNQLFFVAFAQGWCGRVTDKLAKQRLSSDPHSPGPWRVRGSVMNSQAFAQTFGCCPQSKMNPSSKCAVWTDDA